MFTWGSVTLILIKNKVIPGLFLTCSCLIIKVNGKEQARLQYPWYITHTGVLQLCYVHSLKAWGLVAFCPFLQKHSWKAPKGKILKIIYDPHFYDSICFFFLSSSFYFSKFRVNVKKLNQILTFYPKFKSFYNGFKITLVV